MTARLRLRRQVLDRDAFALLDCLGDELAVAILAVSLGEIDVRGYDQPQVVWRLA